MESAFLSDIIRQNNSESTTRNQNDNNNMNVILFYKIKGHIAIGSEYI
jgi:hypothetical protein